MRKRIFVTPKDIREATGRWNGTGQDPVSRACHDGHKKEFIDSLLGRPMKRFNFRIGV